MYRARVDHVRELLTHAGEPPSERSYAYTLLERLQPQYKSVVLALQNSDALKKTKTIDVPASTKTVLDIDWVSVTKLINAHERSEQRLGGNDVQTGVNGDSVMAARATSQPPRNRQKYRSNSKRDLPKVDSNGRPRCFNCNQFGHMASACKSPRAPRYDGEEMTAAAQQTNASEDDDHTEYAFYAQDVAMTGSSVASTESNSTTSTATKKKTYASAAASASSSSSSSASSSSKSTRPIESDEQKIQNQQYTSDRSTAVLDRGVVDRHRCITTREW